MAKNNWQNSDTITRTAMNAPFFVASGVYNSGAARIELQIGPGTIRYPGVTQVVTTSGNAQQVLINNPQVNKDLTLFVRSDGSFMVSGTPTVAGAITTTPAPRWDAEPVAVIQTGASLSTANLVGPWNQGSFQQVEQRGQMGASRLPEVIYQSRPFIAAAPFHDVLNAPGQIVLASVTLDNFHAPFAATVFDAMVTWVPSGSALTGPIGGANPWIGYFAVFRAVDSTYVVVTQDTFVSTTDQNPYVAFPSMVTTYLAGVETISSGGVYRLVHSQNGGGSPGAAIASVQFKATIGQYVISGTNPNA